MPSLLNELALLATASRRGLFSDLGFFTAAHALCETSWHFPPSEPWPNAWLCGPPVPLPDYGNGQRQLQLRDLLSCSLKSVGPSRGLSTHKGRGTAKEALGQTRTPVSSPQETLKDRLSQAGWTRQVVFTIPNAISLGRLIAGPAIATLIMHEAWLPAAVALTAAGISDWLDGYLARRWNHNSVLGSYLDPLADKVLICSVVGALAAQGTLPVPLAAIIIGRDVLLVCGSFVARAHAIGWRHLSWLEFFRLASPLASAHSQGATETGPALPFPHVRRGSTTTAPAQFIRPLWISKANTVLQLGLVGACITTSWYGWPGVEGIWLLGGATMVSTLGSGIAYWRQFQSSK